MESYLDKINHFFEKVPDMVRKYRVVIWAFFMIANIVIVFGAKWFHFDMTMDSYLSQDDPVKLAYDRFRAQFGSDEVIYLLFFFNERDLQRKLDQYKDYYNAQRVHSSLELQTPFAKANEVINAREKTISLDNYRWKSVAGGLYYLPMAA